MSHPARVSVGTRWIYDFPDASAPEGFAAGMELITKPCTVEVLARRLRTMLGDRRSEDVL